MTYRFIFGACALWMPFAAFAGQPCPKFEPGQNYPWQVNGVMRGDQYAEVYIDIDERGRPLKCYIGKTNILRDDRFWTCKAYLDDWHTEPVIQDGKAVRGTVRRDVILTGDEHLKANRDARKRWFEEHPAEQPKCYPE